MRHSLEDRIEDLVEQVAKLRRRIVAKVEKVKQLERKLDVQRRRLV